MVKGGSDPMVLLEKVKLNYFDAYLSQTMWNLNI